MAVDQRVRFRSTSRLHTYWKLPSSAVGTVLCRYQLLNGPATAERLDVRFGEALVLWGAPASEFEPTDEAVTG